MTMARTPADLPSDAALKVFQGADLATADVSVHEAMKPR
jgi:hypothetical protein